MLDHPLQRFFNALRPQPTFQWERFQQRDVLIIDHPACHAVFSRQGAQLLHFQPAGDKPWLWCAAHWPQAGAIRGGVPVCWPWYGRHPGEGVWPAHGWARLIDWKLLQSHEDDEGVSLHWRLQLWDWQVDLHARLGARLTLELVTEHQDSEPCQVSQALLAYWRIGDVGEVSLSGLEGLEGYDRLSRTACKQRGKLRVDGGCERVFASTGTLRLDDRAWERSLAMDTGQNQDTTVWHPGGRPLIGVAGSETQGFVCVESATSRSHPLCLAAGEQTHLTLNAIRLS